MPLSVTSAFKARRFSLFSQPSVLLLSITLASFLAPISNANDIKEGELVEATIKTQTIAKGITLPWGMTWLDSTHLLVTERAVGGWVIDVNNGEKQPVTGWPSQISTSGQGGLLDVLADKNFTENKMVYVSYTHEKNGLKTTRVASAVLENQSATQWHLNQWKVLFTATPYSNKSHHFGSRLGQIEHYLFITVGDRGERHRAQDLTDNAGKVHRIYTDGTIPLDNPFVGTKTPDGQTVVKSIFSYGHRNPQGLYIDHEQNIWVNEHGPRGGDELNLVQAGKNYGWPIITYGKEYWGPSIGEGTHKEGMQQPHYAYVPSIATSGLVLYEADLFPGWQGSFLIGALKKKHLNRLELDDKPIQQADKSQFTEYRYLTDFGKRIRDIEVGPDGAVYLLTDEVKGQLLKITPSSTSTPKTTQ